MTEEQKLIILKKDLQMITASNDEYLKVLLQHGAAAIEREGITLQDDIECSMAVIHYAAYLFRKRNGTDTAMPRYLRYELNNLLFHQAAEETT